MQTNKPNTRLSVLSLSLYKFQTYCVIMMKIQNSVVDHSCLTCMPFASNFLFCDLLLQNVSLYPTQVGAFINRPTWSLFADLEFSPLLSLQTCKAPGKRSACQFCTVRLTLLSRDSSPCLASPLSSQPACHRGEIRKKYQTIILVQ